MTKRWKSRDRQSRNIDITCMITGGTEICYETKSYSNLRRNEYDRKIHDKIHDIRKSSNDKRQAGHQ